MLNSIDIFTKLSDNVDLLQECGLDLILSKNDKAKKKKFSTTSALIKSLFEKNHENIYNAIKKDLVKNFFPIHVTITFSTENAHFPIYESGVKYWSLIDYSIISKCDQPLLSFKLSEDYVWPTLYFKRYLRHMLGAYEYTSEQQLVVNDFLEKLKYKTYMERIYDTFPVTQLYFNKSYKDIETFEKDLKKLDQMLRDNFQTIDKTIFETDESL